MLRSFYDEKRVEGKEEKVPQPQVAPATMGSNIFRAQPNELMVLHQQCEMRTRLVYFGFKFLGFMFGTVEQTETINPFVARKLIIDIKNNLSQAKKEYEKINKALNQPLARNDFRRIIEILDGIVEYTTNSRRKLLSNLKLFLQVEKIISFIDIPEAQLLSRILAQIQDLVTNIDCLLSSVLDATKASGAPPEEARRQLETKLREDQEIISIAVGQITDPTRLFHALLNKILQYYLEPVSNEALKLARKTLLLQKWQAELKNQSEKILKLFPAKGLKYILRVKSLLFDGKPQFYKKLFEPPAFGQLAAQSLMAAIITENPEGRVQPRDIVKMLMTRERAADAAIKTVEHDLQDYDWAKGILTSFIRFWTKGYYYQFSAAYFEFFEELTDKERCRLQNVPVLNTRLSEGYLSFFTTIGSALLIKVDSVISEWIGIGARGNYGIVKVLFTSLLSQLDSFVFYLGELLGLDEEGLINALPIIRWVAGLGITISTVAIGFGLGAEVAGYVATGYIIGSLCRDLCGRLFDGVRNKLTKDSEDASTTNSSRMVEFGIKLPLQHLSFCLGSIYFGPKVYDKLLPLFVTPPRDELLANSATCLKFQSACKKEALKTLGFNEVKKEPTAQEIHLAWRDLMRNFHPDKNKAETADSLAADLNNARDRLLDLGLKFSSN